MAIRVALMGTGNCGALALRHLINDARFDLTGVWVSTEAKVGRDAGELAGLDVTTGITATDDLDAIIAAKPDCVVYTAMGDTRPREALADVRTLLSAGINVVGSSVGALQYPWGLLPDKAIQKVEDAAREGDSTVFFTGVDPGFCTDLLPFALAGTCQSIEQIRTMEIADYATYDGETVMFDVMGFGNADRRSADSVSTGRAVHRVGHRDPAAGRGARHRGRRNPRFRRAGARPRGLERRGRHHQEGHGRGGPLPDRGHGRRQTGHRRRARNTTATLTSAPIGRSPHIRAAPTESRSPANRRISATSFR